MCHTVKGADMAMHKSLAIEDLGYRDTFVVLVALSVRYSAEMVRSKKWTICGQIACRRAQKSPSEYNKSNIYNPVQLATRWESSC